MKFKIVGHYVMSPLESTETFQTREAAQAENRKWTNDAKKQGLRWRGRVVPSEEKGAVE